MTIVLSLFGESLPRVLYATGTFCSVSPDSRVNEGIIAMCWSGMSDANGFSGWLEALSTGFSKWLHERWVGILTVFLGRQGDIDGPCNCLHDR